MHCPRPSQSGAAGASWATKASMRVVLPMPASPVMKSSLALAMQGPAPPVWSWASSAWRPTTRGGGERAREAGGEAEARGGSGARSAPSVVTRTTKRYPIGHCGNVGRLRAAPSTRRSSRIQEARTPSLTTVSGQPRSAGPLWAPPAPPRTPVSTAPPGPWAAAPLLRPAATAGPRSCQAVGPKIPGLIS